MKLCDFVDNIDNIDGISDDLQSDCREQFKECFLQAFCVRVLIVEV